MEKSKVSKRKGQPATTTEALLLKSKTKAAAMATATATVTVIATAKAEAVAIDDESTVDSSIGDPREWDNRRASAQATRAANARQASGRRRFVDPTTCEREYSKAEMEFMHAMHDYKQSSGRMFPTWSEVLEVIKALGYEKMLEPETPSNASATSKGASALANGSSASRTAQTA